MVSFSLALFILLLRTYKQNSLSFFLFLSSSLPLFLLSPPAPLLLPTSYFLKLFFHLLSHLSFIKSFTNTNLPPSLHSTPLLSSPLLSKHSHPLIIINLLSQFIVILILVPRIKVWFIQRNIHYLVTLSAFQSINHKSFEYEHTTKTYQ
ncbi:hypothetical protein EYC80_009181 [Monilinia laxa]|uniref:Uncharacterized protein n=1 Tax=Monilinia laxa TaxID=61186 RepID=A0A5N6K356_MONLA|nr:hypothetical protein EYC80_009181 [Monilinia laxa]